MAGVWGDVGGFGGGGESERVGRGVGGGRGRGAGREWRVYKCQGGARLCLGL